jgi:hypothetical protein
MRMLGRSGMNQFKPDLSRLEPVLEPLEGDGEGVVFGREEHRVIVAESKSVACTVNA